MKIPLFLDHFYFVLKEDAFAEAKHLANFFPCAEYRKNITRNLSWEGVYFYAQSGTYFEFIRESDDWSREMVGFAFSRHGEEDDLQSQLLTSYPHISWEQGEIYRPQGSLWFKNTMCHPQGTSLYLWVMDYQGEIERRLRRDRGRQPENAFLGISSMSFSLPSSVFEKAASLWDWNAEAVQISKKEISCQIPQKHSLPLVLKIQSDDRQAFAIHLSTDDTFLKLPTGFKHLDLEIVGERTIVIKKN